MNLFTQSHRRFNPLTNEWILVSPHRTQRPWLGQVETPAPDSRPTYDPSCYLCPGNERAGHKHNPQYDGVFVFDNDFAALVPTAPQTQDSQINAGNLLRAESERGICRVICFSPRHDLTLPNMPRADICQIVETWVAQTRELGGLDWVNYVLVFENKGTMMGASNPHPHCQVWASEHIPTEPAKELYAQKEYHDTRHHCLLCDYLALELKTGERVVMHNEHFVTVVPFWAVWPFETMLLARRHLGSFTEMSNDERDALADIIQRLTARYDRLFNVSFPYSMGFHQSPTDNTEHPETHLHAHFYPPLLRSATIRKFMVGYEMLGNPQRDITPEIAAARLREIGEP
jgi:UDPglucose--hexose-1-phosphate uridylyltransferase